MQLFVINATPVRVDVDAQENTKRLAEYASNVATILGEDGLDGFTLEKVQGYWQGIAEDSFNIKVATDKADIIRKACAKLRDKYNQDAVMLTLPDNTVEFI